MKTMSIVAWVCLATYAVAAGVTAFAGRNATGERAVGMIIPLMMAPAILLFGGALVFARHRRLTSTVTIIAVLLAAPIALFGYRIIGQVFTALTQKLMHDRRNPPPS